MKTKWFQNHVAYTMAKYGMSMCVLGMAEEFREQGVPFNALWPRTGIATAATRMLGGEEMAKACRKPEIMADAAYAILTRPSRTCTGNFFIDEDVLRAEWRHRPGPVCGRPEHGTLRRLLRGLNLGHPGIPVVGFQVDAIEPQPFDFQMARGIRGRVTVLWRVHLMKTARRARSWSGNKGANLKTLNQSPTSRGRSS